jgi:hypothetical protein
MHSGHAFGLPWSSQRAAHCTRPAKSRAALGAGCARFLVRNDRRHPLCPAPCPACGLGFSLRMAAAAWIHIQYPGRRRGRHEAPSPLYPGTGASSGLTSTANVVRLLFRGGKNTKTPTRNGRMIVPTADVFSAHNLTSSGTREHVVPGPIGSPATCRNFASACAKVSYSS